MIYKEMMMFFNGLKKMPLPHVFIGFSAILLIANIACAKAIRIGNQGDALSMDPHSLNESPSGASLHRQCGVLSYAKAWSFMMAHRLRPMMSCLA
jgi:hypothetical protein